MTVDEAPKASRREWVGLAVIALPCLLYSMDLRLFRTPAFSASLTAFVLSIFVIAGIYFIAQYLQLALGLSPLEAGLWTLPSASGLTAGGRPGRPPLERCARSSGESCQACCVVGVCLCQVIQDRIQTSVLSHEL
jgi:hypothetical protein